MSYANRGFTALPKITTLPVGKELIKGRSPKITTLQGDRNF